MGALVLAAVHGWPHRPGLRTSDLLDLDEPLRVALVGALRSRFTTASRLSEDLGVPVEEARLIAAALVDRGALERTDEEHYRIRIRSPAPQPRRATRWLDALSDGGES